MTDDELNYLDWEPDGPCDHEDYEIDIVAGRWSCANCCEIRAATTAEMDMMFRHQAEYAEYEAAENRREWWRDLWARVLSIIPKRKRIAEIGDDDIPF